MCIIFLNLVSRTFVGSFVLLVVYKTFPSDGRNAGQCIWIANVWTVILFRLDDGLHDFVWRICPFSCDTGPLTSDMCIDVL